MKFSAVTSPEAGSTMAVCTRAMSPSLTSAPSPSFSTREETSSAWISPSTVTSGTPSSLTSMDTGSRASMSPAPRGSGAAQPASSRAPTRERDRGAAARDRRDRDTVRDMGSFGSTGRGQLPAEEGGGATPRPGLRPAFSVCHVRLDGRWMSRTPRQTRGAGDR
ncbi:hypothetical protein ACFFX0_04545 [Citricoccus parietis]|uniref:Uncharacterized protein n=1 Tax=Citricoccus parietis TaxID=592307 RepID=A0ABV5FV31_9MICC